MTNGFDPELVRGNITAMVLSVLEREGEAYGYEIAKALVGASGGRIKAGQGTLYPALHDLEESGQVSARWTRGEGRKRKYYRLTAKGRKALAERRAEWKEFSGFVRAMLKPA